LNYAKKWFRKGKGIELLRIIVDGSADMPVGWPEKYQFEILPMPIQIGNKTYYQGEDITPELFYELMQDKDVHPQTAAPSPDRIKNYIEKVCEAGDTILSINVSGKMSATVSMVQKAANQLKEKFAMTVFDSQAGSAVLAMMAREARLLDNNGTTLTEILEILNKMREKVLVVLTVGSLEFAYRSGRVGAIKTALSSFLKIKPIVTLHSGVLSVSEMVRTRSKSLNQLVSKVRDQFGSQKIKVAIVHSQDQETAEALKVMIDEVLNTTETIFTELSITVAANLGPKTVGIVALPDKL